MTAPGPQSPITNPDTIRVRALVAFITVCIVWGTTYLAIRVALDTIPPLLMAAMRWMTAGAVLIAALKVRGEKLPEPRAWPALALLGILLQGVGNGAVVWAEQTIPSGLTAVIVATVPFWMVGIDAIAAPRGSVRLTLRSIIGLIVGFAGIVVLVWPEIHVGEAGKEFFAGVIALQIACAGWSIGSSYARHRGRTHAESENVLATAAFEMLFGGLALLVAGIAIGETSHLTFTMRTGGALAYLIVFGSIAGFTAYAYALKHMAVATVSLYAYVNPVIAVALGTLLLHEPFGLRTIVGAAVVFAGVVLVRR